MQRLGEWVSVFAPDGMFRMRCRLCGRELYAASRWKHAHHVHAALLKSRQIVHTWGKWQMPASLAGTQPKRAKR